MLIAAPNRITNNVGRGDAERGPIIGPERTIQVPAELVERCYLNREVHFATAAHGPK